MSSGALSPSLEKVDPIEAAAVEHMKVTPHEGGYSRPPALIALRASLASIAGPHRTVLRLRCAGGRR